MDTARTAEAHIPEGRQGMGVPSSLGVSTNAETFRPSIHRVQPLALDKVDTKARNKKIVASLQKPFICISVLFIAYMFTYSVLHAITLMFSH